MNATRRTWIGAGVGLAACAAGVVTWTRLRPGQPDPAAQLLATRLPDTDGTMQAVAQWAGRVLVVNFWATWCAPCREEIPVLVRLQEKYGPRGLQFVGIAIDDAEKVRAFAREFRINYPLLLGAIDTVELSRQLGNRVGVLPYTLVLDRGGKVSVSFPGGVKESALEAAITPLI